MNKHTFKIDGLELMLYPDGEVRIHAAQGWAPILTDDQRLAIVAELKRVFGTKKVKAVGLEFRSGLRVKV